jgi:hypothetical protein
MGSTSKGFSLLLVVILAVSTLILVESATAQSIPKPSVPEFTVKYVDSSYDVPTTTSIDQYTGKTVTNQGYHVDNKSIEIAIKNQPFTPYMQSGESGHYIALFYNVRERGAFAQNWTEIYSAGRGYLLPDNGTYSFASYSLTQNEFPFWEHVTNGGTIEFQVQTLIGYTWERHYSDDGQFIPFPSSYFVGEVSDWTSTQSLSIPETSTPPTSTPSVSEFSLWTSPLLLTIMLGIAGLLVYFKKQKRTLVKEV